MGMFILGLLKLIGATIEWTCKFFYYSFKIMFLATKCVIIDLPVSILSGFRSNKN